MKAMPRSVYRFLAPLLCFALGMGVSTARAGDPAEGSIRIATFNVALNREKAGELGDELRSGDCQQATKLARIVQSVRPHILLINELDYDGETNVRLLQDLYFNKGDRPISYPYHFVAPVNTGVPSGCDLDGSGTAEDPGDCFGFGRFPGQYGMAVFSLFPIDTQNVRTFQNFLWKDMPNSLFPPIHPETKEAIFDSSAADVLRLSSKSHWDVPVRVGDKTMHFLVSHPTPPVFDGPEDRNGRRNHDEIRLWADYIDEARSSYLRDDQGKAAGLSQNSLFVIAGDLNADPLDGDSYPGAVDQLLRHPLVDATLIPASEGGVEQAQLQGAANQQHRGAAANDTGDFADGENAPGNLRIDYVLPSRTLHVTGSGVFWPRSDQPEFAWVSASDHRLVWIDVVVGLRGAGN